MMAGAGESPLLLRSIAPVTLRLALSVAFLSAVADRLGLWGDRGTRNVDWGSPGAFNIAFEQLNPWVPIRVAPALAWVVTALETVLGVLLLLDVALAWTALISALLLTLFGLSMAAFQGLKAPLNYSVFSAAAGALTLATISQSLPA